MGLIPAMITIDVHQQSDIAVKLGYLVVALEETGIKATIFFPAILLKDKFILSAVRKLKSHGHEIGCHGLTHEVDEAFNTLPMIDQRKRLTMATKIFEDKLGDTVVTFRAPAFRLSSVTLQVLEELNYLADSSIPSTRLSLLSSDLWSFGYSYAPRLPYHPHRENPFRRGSMKIWEIPVSCFLIVFSVSFLQVFGLKIAQAFLTGLKAESRLTGKPIVYMAHIEDFYPSRVIHPRKKFKLKYFLPSREHGFEARYLLEERDEYKTYQLTKSFLPFIVNNNDVKIITIKEYIKGNK